jgi:hypothetical protein
MKALCIVAMCGLAFAFESVALAGDFIVWGAGNDSCGTFVQERATSSVRFRTEINWIAGSLSRANGEFSATMARKGIRGADILSNLDHGALEMWLVGYCEKNPLKNLSSAALALETTLYDRLTSSIKRPTRDSTQ